MKQTVISLTKNLTHQHSKVRKITLLVRGQTCLSA